MGYGGFLFLVALTALSEGISAEWEHRTGYASQKLKDERLIEKLGGVRAAKALIWRPTPLEGGALRNIFPQKKPAKIIVQWTGRPGPARPLPIRLQK